MDRRTRLAIGVMGLCVLAGLVPAQGPSASPTNASPRQALATGLQQIAQDADGRRAVLKREYGTALKLLRGKVRAAGDLDGLLAVDAELKRIAGGDWLAASTSAQPLPALADLQARCAKALAAIAADQHAARIRVYKQQVVALEQQMRELVRADRLDAAKNVNQELCAVQFELAELEAARPQPATSAPAPVPAMTAAAPLATTTAYWLAPRSFPVPPYAAIHHRALAGVSPLALPYMNHFDGRSAVDLENARVNQGLLTSRSTLSVTGYGYPVPGQPTYGPCLTAPFQYGGDFTMRAVCNVTPGVQEAGRMVMFAVFEGGETVAVALTDASHQSAAMTWNLDAFPPRATGTIGEPLAFAAGSRSVDLTIERQGNRILGRLSGRAPQLVPLSSAAGCLITAGLTLERSTLPESIPLALSVDSFEVQPTGGEPTPAAAVAALPEDALPTLPAAGPTPEPAAKALLKIDFTGSDVPRFRRDGTGQFVERNGRLSVENFGTNTKLTDFYGMRLIAPMTHGGDFRLVSPVTLHSAGGGAGLIRLTAHFANRAEAVCELSATGPYATGQAVFRLTGQADQAQSVYFSSESRYYSMRLGASYLVPDDLPLTIERKGARISVSAGSLQLGTGELKSAGTVLTSISVDILRARDKNSTPAEMWVESLALSTP